MSYKVNQEKLEINSSGVLNTTNVPPTAPPDGSITTAKLADGAVTGIKRTSTVLGSTVLGNGLYLDEDGFIGSVTVTSSGQKVRISFVGQEVYFSKGSGRESIIAYFALFRNGTFISNSIRTNGFSHNAGATYYSGGGSQWIAAEAAFSVIDENPPAGTNTYTISLNTSEDGGVNRVGIFNVSIVVREV